MTIAVIRNGSDVDLCANDFAWGWVLDHASENGWEPKGTTPLIYEDMSAEEIEQIWINDDPGSYWQNRWIDPEDCQGMADGLDRYMNTEEFSQTGNSNYREFIREARDFLRLSLNGCRTL